MGRNTLVANTTGHSNTAVGYGVLNANTTALYNTGLGMQALWLNTTGTRNTAVGDTALYSTTTGGYNTAIGVSAFYDNTTGASNSAFGYVALGDNTTGADNAAFGNNSMRHNTTGGNNTAMGRMAMYTNTTGSYNVALGRSAMYEITTGGNNVAIGYKAGENITTAGSTVCIGNEAGNDQIDTGHDQLYIARLNTAASNAATWIYGNNSGACYQGNNSSSWSTTSDRRLKKNIVDNTKGLAEINQLRVTNFEYKNEDEIDMSEFPLADGAHQVVLGKGNEGIQTGVIAQEIETVLPECINVSEKGAKTVDTDPIMWVLVNAVKELSEKVTALEAK